MNKDRIEGAGRKAAGQVKEKTGKLTGNPELETEGKADRVTGAVQNTVGKIKDQLKD